MAFIEYRHCRLVREDLGKVILLTEKDSTNTHVVSMYLDMEWNETQPYDIILDYYLSQGFKVVEEV